MYKEKIDVKTAFLYIVTSFNNIGYYDGKLESKMGFNAFQMFFSTLKFMLKYLKLCDFKMDLDAIEHAMQSLNLYYKRNNNNIQNLLRTAYQNHMKVEDKIIFLDGPGDEEKAFKELKSKYTLSMLQNQEIINITGFKKFDFAVNWSYGLDPSGKHQRIKICLNTCRPFFFTKLHPVVTWKDEAIKTFGEKFISSHKNLIQYIVDFDSIPNETTFVSYLAKKYKAHEDGYSNGTLPAHIIQLIKNALGDFKEVFKSLDTKEIAKRFLESERTEDRVRMQNFYPNDYQRYLPSQCYEKNIYVHYAPEF